MGVLSGPTAHAEPAAVVASFLESFSTRDPEAIVAHVAPGYEALHHAAMGHTFAGADEYRKRLPGFLADMVDLRYETVRTVTEGSTVVVAYELTACYKGEHPIRVPGTMWFDVADGRITRRVDYWDSRVFLDQLPEDA